MKRILIKFHQGAITIIFWVIFAGKQLKLQSVDPTFSIFNPCPSLPSVPVADDRRQLISMPKYSLE